MASQLPLDLPLDPDRLRRPLNPSKPRVPCRLCGAGKDTFRPGCLWCEHRRSFYAMDTPEERAAMAADVERCKVQRAAEANAKAAAHEGRMQALRALGRPVRVALVGCGASKRDRAAKARHMYTGSLARAAIQYAEFAADEFWILSAFHGLLSPDQVISPYDRRLPSRKGEREGWGGRVSSSLAGRYAGLAVTVEILAGADYANVLSFPRAWTVSFPLEGLMLGARLRWLTTRSRELTVAQHGTAPRPADQAPTPP